MTLLASKTDFKTKTITREKEGNYRTVTVHSLRKLSEIKKGGGRGEDERLLYALR